MVHHCSVIDCNNRHASLEGNIGFHNFPKDKYLRERWIAATGRHKWYPVKSSVICSKHFDENCLRKTKRNVVLLRGSVPKLFKKESSSPSTYVSTPTLRAEKRSNRICRVCLATNMKMYKLQENNLKAQYEQVTGISTADSEQLPQSLCWECAHRLAACARFRERATLAHRLLEDVLQTERLITRQNIKKIDRNKNGLETTLMQFNLPHRYIGVNLDYNIEQDDEINIDDSDDDLVEEVKEEEINVAIPPIEKNSLAEEVKGEGFEMEMKKKELSENESNGNELDIDMEDKYLSEVDWKENKLDIDIGKKDMSHEDLEENEPKKVIEEKYIVEDFKENNFDFLTKVIDIREEEPMNKMRNKKALEQAANEEQDKESKEKYSETSSTDENDDLYHPRRNKRSIKLDRSIMSARKLSLVEQIQEIEARKESDNYKLAPFRCETCFKGYVDEAAFNLHALKHTNKYGAFECRVCKLRFKVKNSCTKHERQLHYLKFACQLCPFTCSARSQARFHVDYHKGKTYQCPHCDKTFSKMTTRVNHVRMRHPSQFACALCGHSFVSEKGLHHHRSKTHRFEDATVSQENHPCPVCPLRFASERALQTHLEVNHDVIKPSDGETRTVGTRRRLPLDARQRERLRERARAARDVRHPQPAEPLECEQCGIRVADRRMYATHFRRVHPEKTRTRYPVAAAAKRPHVLSMCHVCGRIFKCAALLRYHMDRHSDELRHQCPHCQRRFRVRQLLTCHMKIHARKREVFRCEVCDKTFTQKGNLQRHMLLHARQTAHECSACGKRFVYRCALELHNAYVHLERPRPQRARARRARAAAARPLVGDQPDRSINDVESGKEIQTDEE